MTTAVLWIDEDWAHAQAAQALLASTLPECRVVHGTCAADAAGALASRAWRAVVLCLPPAATDVAGPLAQCAGHPVLLCVSAAQEALAARGFRCGLGDYVLRAQVPLDADGAAAHAHLPELLQRLAALLQQPVVPQGPEQPQALGQLQRQRLALQVTLGRMSQGIFKTGPDGRVHIYNQRVLELLDLPESLMATQPTLAQVTQVPGASLGRPGSIIKTPATRQIRLDQRKASRPSR